MRAPSIECEALRRVYVTGGVLGRRRQTMALDGLDLSIPHGIVFGIVGPNGAGKTTLIRILATLLSPTSGSARVLGYDVTRHASEARKHIGLVLGGDRGLYWRLTGKENLQYFGALLGMTPRSASARAVELLEMVGLDSRAGTLVEEYSRGMRQRLHIARGLFGEPDVILMDEPTIGLDPIIARELRDMVQRLARQGKTVILTTHYMTEADLLCESIALIDHGKLVATGSPSDFKRRLSGIKVIDVTVREARSELTREVAALEGVRRVDEGMDGALQKLSVQVGLTVDLRDRLVNVVDEANVEALVEREATLEEAYLSMLT